MNSRVSGGASRSASRRGHARNPAALANAIGAQLELVPAAARLFLRAGFAHLLFITLAFGGEVDAQQRRADLGEQDGRTDGAEDVGHRVGDGHGVEQLLGLSGWLPEPIDGIGR